MCGRDAAVPRHARRGWLALAFAFSAICASSASAQTEATPAAAQAQVELSIPDCGELSGAQIEELVTLELVTQRKAGEAARAVRAALRCTALHATITVEDPRRATPLVLELELSGTKPEARARVLALAIAELIATSRLERAEPRAAPAPLPRTPPAPAAEPAPSAARGARPLELWLGAGVLGGYEPWVWAPTIAAGVTRHISVFALGAELAFERAQQTSAEARVVADDVSLGIAPSWHARSERLDLGLGPGLRAGYAWLSASPRQSELRGHKLAGTFAVPMLQLSFALRLAPAWTARVALEAGYVAKPVRGFDADRGTLFALHGWRLATLIGAAFWP